MEDVISEPLIHSAHVNQNLPTIQGLGKLMQLYVHDNSIHCWFALYEISQMSLATCSLLRQSRSHLC